MLNRLQVVVVAAVATGIAACATGGAPAAETAADSAAIRALGEKYQVAWNAGDAAALSQLVTDDYHATETNGTVVDGKAAYEAMAKTTAEARKGAGMTLEIAPAKTIFLSPTAAASNGTWTLKGVPAGGGPDKGSYIVVSAKGADGQWRVRSSLAAAFVPPPAPPPAKPPK